MDELPKKTTTLDTPLSVKERFPFNKRRTLVVFIVISLLIILIYTIGSMADGRYWRIVSSRAIYFIVKMFPQKEVFSGTRLEEIKPEAQSNFLDRIEKVPVRKGAIVPIGQNTINMQENTP
jgi:hypothetical protein